MLALKILRNSRNELSAIQHTRLRIEEKEYLKRLKDINKGITLIEKSIKERQQLQIVMDSCTEIRKQISDNKPSKQIFELIKQHSENVHLYLVAELLKV